MGCGGYRGIDLVELVWKLVTVILNHHFSTSIAIHDVLHGFQTGSGTCTASLEAMLIHQLTDMREDFMYTIFLYLHKSYNALERNIFLEILEW